MNSIKKHFRRPEGPERRPPRAAYALPTFFTACNLFLGYIAILQSFNDAAFRAVAKGRQLGGR